MSLKALAEAALQQCAPRTIDRTSPQISPAHYPLENETVRTLSDGEKSALAIAERAIALAALTDTQKTSRLADIEREPSIAYFWAQLQHHDEQKKECEE
jgi:hypothetical protein